MTTRVQRMLGRLPVHFVPTRPGKGLSAVADALARPLEVLSTDLAGVRRAHRIGHAAELTDVLLIAGLHGLTRGEMGLLFRRWDVLRQATLELEGVAAGPEPERAAAAAALLRIWGLGGAGADLEAFAPARPEGDPPDLEAAAERLADAVRRSLAYPQLVERARERVLTSARQHSLGNGTIRALLVGTANALDLDVDESRNARVKRALLRGPGPLLFDTVVADDLFHSTDHFWHATYVRERGPLIRPVPALAPANVVVVGPASTISELAAQSGTAVADLLAAASAAGLEVSDPDVVVGLDAAVAIAEASGLEPERAPRGTLQVRGATAAAEVARMAGVRLPELLARLAALGSTGVEADTMLAPSTVARAVRRFGYAVELALEPPLSVIGIEENPRYRVTYDQEDCPHGHRFQILRRGFGRTLMRAEVEGLPDVTVGPMLVNRDEGRGFGWFGTVAEGAVLRFEEEGRVFLDDADVTDRAFSWRGACFADAAERHRNDFVFPGPTIREERWARTAEARPPGALDRDAIYPHADEDLEMPGVAVGVTRMAFFVQIAHLSSREGTPLTPVVRRPTPHTYIGFADESVFSAVPDDTTPVPYPAWLPPGFPVAAHVRLSWLEHEAYAVRILVPPRLETLDEEGVPARAWVLDALERFRPAGVELRVDTIDDRWILGDGLLVSEAGQDPLSILRGSTVLWAPPADTD